MATSVENRGDEKAPVELSAPEGWKKTLLPQKSGTPRRKSVAFISPTGEEIKSKRQLDQYLKSHPGGPSSSEFDWSSGETPRRSRRLSEKSKATESPESEPPRKRQNKSSLEKAEDDADGEDKAAEEKDDVREETKTSQDVEMKEVADARGPKKGEESIENAVTEEKGVKGDETSAERTEDPGSDNNKTTDEKDEQVANNIRAEWVDNKEEAEEQKEPEAPSELEKEKADEKTISTSEEKTDGVSLPTQDLDVGKEGTAKQPADDTKEEKKPDEAKGDKEDEVPTEQLLSDADTKVNNDNLKEAEDGSRPTTNYAIHPEDKTPHEPKASQVSC